MSWVEVFQRLQPHLAQPGAAQVAVHRLAQGVELQVELEAWLVVGQAGGEVRLPGNAQAVGVDHQVVDRPPPRRVEDGEERRMQGGLAAGDLHYVGLALVRHHGVEHALHRGEVAEARPVRAAFGVADRAAQVAVVGDLDQGEAGVLHVLGAQAAVVGAAEVLRRVEALRQLRRLDVDLAALPVIRRVVGQQHALAAVLGAPFLQVDAFVLDQDLRLHPPQAGGADRHRAVVEQVRPYLGSHALRPLVRSDAAIRGMSRR